MKTFLTIFQRFLNTFWRFLKILQKLPKGQTNVSDHFPKIDEDFEEELKIFWSHSNTFKYFVRDYVTIAMVTFSLMKNNNMTLLFLLLK